MARTSKLSVTRRGKGRPARDQPGVGRAAVVAAASAFLKRQTPREITRAEFSRAAGIDPSLVRYYFGNISSLLTEGMRDIFNELQTRRASVAPNAPLRVQLRQRIGSLVEVLEANPQLHHLVMAPVIHIEPGKAEEVEALRRDYTLASLESLKSLLLNAQEQGDSVPTDVPLFYIMLVGLSDFAVSRHQYFDILSVPGGNRAEMMSRYVDFVADLLIDGLRPRPV